MEDFFQARTRRSLMREACQLGARNPSEAEEAADVALTEVATHAPTITHPHAYARQVLRNYIIKQKQRDGGARERAFAAKGAGTPVAAIDRDLAQIDGDDWVKSVLQSLGERRQRLMEMYLEGLSYQEIAAALDETVTNVGTMINRTKRHLRNHEEISRLHRSSSPTTMRLKPVGSTSSRRGEPTATRARLSQEDPSEY
jgi:RNA polymerase sigma factor (sigma-70 family)